MAAAFHVEYQATVINKNLANNRTGKRRDGQQMKKLSPSP